MKGHPKGLIDQRIIEHTNSAYAAQSRMILKKNGSGRLVINYILLNLVTHRDSYSMPHVGNLFSLTRHGIFLWSRLYERFLPD